jgi:hypothetical protein
MSLRYLELKKLNQSKNQKEKFTSEKRKREAKCEAKEKA